MPQLGMCRCAALPNTTCNFDVCPDPILSSTPPYCGCPKLNQLIIENSAVLRDMSYYTCLQSIITSLALVNLINLTSLAGLQVTCIPVLMLIVHFLNYTDLGEGNQKSGPCNPMSKYPETVTKGTVHKMGACWIFKVQARPSAPKYDGFTHGLVIVTVMSFAKAGDNTLCMFSHLLT